MISEYGKRVIVGLLESCQERLMVHEDDDQDGRVSSTILYVDQALDEARHIVADEEGDTDLVSGVVGLRRRRRQ